MLFECQVCSSFGLGGFVGLAGLRVCAEDCVGCLGAKSCDPALNETVSNTHVFDTAQSKGSEALFSLPSDWALKIGLRCEMEVVGTDKVPFEWVKTVQRSKPLSGKKRAMSHSLSLLFCIHQPERARLQRRSCARATKLGHVRRCESAEDCGQLHELQAS